jgi:hypothetical protein
LNWSAALNSILTVSDGSLAEKRLRRIASHEFPLCLSVVLDGFLRDQAFWFR